MARVDAQLELAAKKAALAGMQRAAQEGSADAQAPAAPAAATGRIVIEKDGKTITLENPTAEQLRAVGVGSTQQRSGDVSGWQLVGVIGAVMWGIVAIVYLVLAHRRRMSGVTSAKPSADSEARMVRIENAIESVAVEVERISEGQRFTSRILSEGAAVPVGAVDRGTAMPQNRGDAR